MKDCQPQQQYPLYDALDTLERNVQSLGENIDKLMARLESVTTPVPPCPTSDAKPYSKCETITSGVTGKVREYSLRIKALDAALADRLSRLEV